MTVQSCFAKYKNKQTTNNAQCIPLSCYQPCVTDNSCHRTDSRRGACTLQCEIYGIFFTTFTVVYFFIALKKNFQKSFNETERIFTSIAVLVKSTDLHCNEQLSMMALEFHCQICFSVGVIPFYACTKILKALNQTESNSQHGNIS